MPNYEIVHDRVGPFPRQVHVTRDGVRTLQVDTAGKEIPRVVSGTVLDATSPATKTFEGNIKVWLRAGAIKETDTPVTPLSTMEQDVLNSPSISGTPAHTEIAVTESKGGGVSDITPTTTTTASSKKPV